MVITKKESGYVLPVKTTDSKGLRCDNCYFYDSEKETCSPVKGHIETPAICNLWSKTNKLSLNWLSAKDILKILPKRKVTKIEAGYIDGRSTVDIKPKRDDKGTRCGSCISFIKGHTRFANGCKGVDGEINKYGCCNLWRESDSSKLEYISGVEVRQKLCSKSKKHISDHPIKIVSISDIEELCL